MAFESIIKKIITKEDLIFFLEEINLLRKFIFQNTETPLSEKVRGKLSEDFREYLQKIEREGLISQSPNQQLSFFEELKKYFRELPQIKLEIAFLPSKEFLLRMRDWLKTTIGKEIILDIVLNPGVVGGAIIEYQGSYFNSSVAKEIDKLQMKTGG